MISASADLPTVVMVLTRPQDHALRRLEKLFRVVVIDRPDPALVDPAVRPAVRGTASFAGLTRPLSTGCHGSRSLPCSASVTTWSPHRKPPAATSW